MAQRKVNCEVYTDRGIVGKDGADGKSAYQQAVEGGYQGTEEEFEQALASDIATIANNVTNINVVGNNIENVNTAVDNMAAIIAAPTAATQAAASASQAATSATNAQTSETNAATSASNAAASATNASSSATIATTKASEATSSATSASASANSASESATIATTQAELAKEYADSIDLSNYRTSADQDIIDATKATKAELAGYLPLSSKAVANGVASLDANAKVPSEQIPVATASALGGVKPDGTTITVTEDGVISVPVSAEVATKADLQDKVNKTGDTMTGTLKISGNNEVRFGTDDNFYHINQEAGSQYLTLYHKNGRGLLINGNQNGIPYYYDGTNYFRLLTTADLQNIDYVVESQVNADGSWYRKYKSGWLEQGGLLNVANATVTFPKPFSDAPATLLLCNANTASAYTGKPTSVTATSFVIWQYQGYYKPCYWYVCGHAA